MVWTPSSINNLRTKQGTRLEKLYYELNGVRTEFVGSAKYFGEPGTADIWRIFVNASNQLVRQRYENGSWVDYGADGSSTSFTDIILRGTEYGLYSQDSAGTYRPLIRPAFTDEKGSAVGTKDGIIAIIHDGNALSWEPGDAYDETRNDGVATSELTEYTEDVTPSASSFLDTFYYYVSSVESGTKLRVSATSDSGNLLYENVSEYEFSLGDGADVVTGENAFDLDPTAFRDVAGNTYEFKMEFSENVTLLGSGSFSAKLRTVGKYADINSIVLIPSWSNRYSSNSGSFTSGEVVYENGFIYICRVTGAQATDFATNINKWAKLGTVVLSGGVFGGQTVNGGLDNNEDLNLSSTADATKGNINFGENSTYDELNDRLGLNTNSPTVTLDVNGDTNVTGFTKLGDDINCHPIKYKCFCGTLPNNLEYSVSHGLDWTKIVNVRVMVFDGSVWWFGEFNEVVQPARAVQLFFNATKVFIDDIGTAFQGKDYRMTITYIE